MHVAFLTALLVSFMADGLVDAQNVHLGLVEHPMVYTLMQFHLQFVKSGCIKMPTKKNI